MAKREDSLYAFVDSIKNKEGYSHLQRYRRLIKKVIPKNGYSGANRGKKKHYCKDKS